MLEDMIAPRDSTRPTTNLAYEWLAREQHLDVVQDRVDLAAGLRHPQSTPCSANNGATREYWLPEKTRSCEPMTTGVEAALRVGRCRQ